MLSICKCMQKKHWKLLNHTFTEASYSKVCWQTELENHSKVLIILSCWRPDSQVKKKKAGRCVLKVTSLGPLPTHRHWKYNQGLTSVLSVLYVKFRALFCPIPSLRYRTQHDVPYVERGSQMKRIQSLTPSWSALCVQKSPIDNALRCVCFWSSV